MSTALPVSQPGISQSQIVEASAGTGKTRELVQQVVEMIAAGTPVQKIAAVTFTHAAAGEMKWRVRQGLESARLREIDLAAREHLAEALRHLDRAFIGTIHSFCAHLLRQRPVEACVDPSFQELDQGQAYDVFSEVFREWVERKLAAPPAVLERVLARLAWRDSADEGDPLDSLRRAAWDLVEWRDYPTGWTARDIDRTGELDRLVDRAAAVIMMRSRCRRPGQDPLYASLQPLADLLDRVKRTETRDYNAIESDVLQLPSVMRWLRKGTGQFGDAVSREAMLAAWQELETAIKEARETLDADLACALRNQLWELVALYQDAKRRRGQLDFMDLLIQAGKLLQHAGARRYFQQRYDRILIDEFQDTDPLQAEVLLLLSAADPEEHDWRRVTPHPGKLFLVGDPKQSIYRFRRADVGLYRRIAVDLGGRGVVQRSLQSSRRSVKPIHDFVNAAFANRMADYLPLDGGRDPLPRQPHIIALPMPYPYGTKNIAKKSILACSPNAVAAFIEWLVQSSGWVVSDPQEPGRTLPMAPEHVCILFRRFSNWGTDLTQDYVRSLEARGLPHVLVGSKSFHRREEIGCIRTALRAIEWPDDELSVFATIRGPLFAVSDGTLLKFRDAHGGLHPFKTLPDDLDEEFAPVLDALTLIGELHRNRNHAPLADTINRLLEHTRSHAGFAFRKGGGRVLANVYRLTDMARAFEARGGISFRSFIACLERDADQGEASEAPLLEQQAGGVKIMTVHRAKGLEFPVVILADLTAKLTGGEGGDRWVESDKGLCAQRLLGCAPWELIQHRDQESAADREEAERVAYVAATRARDLLVVSAIGEQEFAGGWLEPLYPALYPQPDRRRLAGKHPGCKMPGDRTVLERPPEYGGDESSVRPGVHYPQVGQHEVVWFDPALLNLKQQKDEGLAFEAVLTGSPEEGLARYKAWRTRREENSKEASRPEYRIVRATETGNSPATAIPIEVITLPRPVRGRSSGRAFGRLVHCLLAEGPLPDDPAEREAIARTHARICGAGAEMEAALALAVAAVEHPFLQTMLKAPVTIYREMPLMLKQDDCRLVEGRVDLAFTDGQSWSVVEFKTDSADQMRYRRQLQLYGAALQQATGLPVKGVLLEV